MKDETILILAGVGIVGYGLLKSDFFEGIGGGVSSAVGGAGSFIKETFIEGGGIVREISNFSQNTLRDAGQLVDTTIQIPQDIISTTGRLTDEWTDVFERTWSPTNSQGIVQTLGRGLRSAVNNPFSILTFSPMDALVRFSQNVLTRDANTISSGITPTSTSSSVATATSTGSTSSSGGSSSRGASVRTTNVLDRQPTTTTNAVLPATLRPANAISNIITAPVRLAVATQNLLRRLF